MAYNILLKTHSQSSFCDVDWASCPNIKRITIGYFIFLGANHISWLSNKQPTIVWSSVEVKY